MALTYQSGGGFVGPRNDGIFHVNVASVLPLYEISRGDSIRYEEISSKAILNMRRYLNIRKHFFFFCYSRKFYIVEKLKIEKFYARRIYISCFAWYAKSATFNKIAASNGATQKQGSHHRSFRSYRKIDVMGIMQCS